MALGCVRVDLTVRLRRGVEGFLTRLLVYFVPHFSFAFMGSFSRSSRIKPGLPPRQYTTGEHCC